MTYSIKPHVETPAFPATYQIGDHVEVRGASISGGDYHWHGGYFIILQKWDNKEWWYGVSRPYLPERLEPSTQLSQPILYPESLLRKPTTYEKNQTIIGHYTGKNFFAIMSQYWRGRLNEIPKWRTENDT